MSIVFFREADHSVPLLDWLDGLPERPRLACVARIELLAELGHRLRRPHAENLGEGIWELRAKVEGINYRILYFFHGQQAVVLSHGLIKQQAEVPATEIKRARARKLAFGLNPAKHTYKE
jgi:phage-related protein